MKEINQLKSDWFVLVLGVALVSGGFAYLKLEAKIRADENYGMLLNQVSYDQRVSAVLRQLHDGEGAAAAKKLDAVLCADVLRLDSQLVAADDRTREFVLRSFEQIAHFRPRIPVPLGEGVSEECSEDLLAAQKILAQAATREQAAR